jgi:hypothetical protein
MDIEMVFNELSISGKDIDKFQARELMSKLVDTLREATKAGVQSILRTSEDLNYIELAPNYSIAQWRTDREADRDQRNFLILLTAKSPYNVDTTAEIQSQFNLTDVSFRGRKSDGLRFVAITDSIAISFASASEWDKSILSIDLEQIDDDGEIISSSIQIKHASSQQHIEEITPWIRWQLSRNIKDGRQLWLNRSKLFDRIDFCDCVEKQLIDILAGDPKLKHIVNILSIINQKCQSWDVGSLSLEGLDESGESESTRNNSNFRKKRTFRCPDGQERVFEPHVKLKFCNWRIHFLAETPGRVIIGYVGAHLPTTKYPT